MRMSVEIDDELMKKAMEVTGIKTKKGVVAEALRVYIYNHSGKSLADFLERHPQYHVKGGKAPRKGKQTCAQASTSTKRS